MNRRGLFAAATVGALFFVPPAAHAADPPASAVTNGASPASAVTNGASPASAVTNGASPASAVTNGASPASAGDAGASVAPRASAGLAVLALPGAGSAAWTLAQSIYATDALRPVALDEAHARVLAGEPAPPGSAKELVDLADTRAAVRGDDAPSRALLASIANTFHLRGIVVVEMASAAHPSARVFVMSTGDRAGDVGVFDAARYEPDAPAADASREPGREARDAGASPTLDASAAVTPLPSPAPERVVRWTGATTSLARAFAMPAASAASAPLTAPPLSAPSLATSSVPDAPHEAASKGSTPFFKSPWFWGAVGAAAFGTTAIYFATRDNSSSTIHLELQAPK